MESRSYGDVLAALQAEVLTNPFRAVFQWSRLRNAVEFAQEDGVVVQTNGDFRVLRTKSLFKDDERSLIQGLGFRISMSRLVENSKVVKRHCQVRMLRAEQLFLQSQGLPVELFRLIEPSLRGEICREIVKRSEERRVGKECRSE